MIGIFLFNISPIFPINSASSNSKIVFFACKIDSYNDFLLILEF